VGTPRPTDNRFVIIMAGGRGERFDIGNKLDFLKTNVIFGLAHPEVSAEFREFIKETARQL